MSIADLFDSEFKNRMKGRFAAVARVLFADGTFDPDEKKFLDKLAIKLEITDYRKYSNIAYNITKFAQKIKK